MLFRSIYIDDVINANILALNATKNGVYNVGTAVPRSFQDIADILQSELCTSLGTEYFKNPYTAYQMHTQADISLSKKYLNYEPKFTLESGIKAYVGEIKRICNAKIR